MSALGMIRELEELQEAGVVNRPEMNGLWRAWLLSIVNPLSIGIKAGVGAGVGAGIGHYVEDSTAKDGAKTGAVVGLAVHGVGAVIGLGLLLAAEAFVPRS